MNEKLNFSQMDFLKFYKNKSKRTELLKNSMLHLSKKSNSRETMFPIMGLGCVLVKPQGFVLAQKRATS